MGEELKAEWVLVPRALLADSLRDLTSSFPREVQVVASMGGGDTSIERLQAVLASPPVSVAAALQERLQAIIDWADFALTNPQEFDSHGVRNLDGPVFDEARAILSRIQGDHGASVAESAASLASQPDCSAAQRSAGARIICDFMGWSEDGPAWADALRLYDQVARTAYREGRQDREDDFVARVERVTPPAEDSLPGRPGHTAEDGQLRDEPKPPHSAGGEG